MGAFHIVHSVHILCKMHNICNICMVRLTHMLRRHRHSPLAITESLLTASPTWMRVPLSDAKIPNLRIGSENSNVDRAMSSKRKNKNNNKYKPQLITKEDYPETEQPIGMKFTSLIIIAVKHRALSCKIQPIFCL